MSRYLDSMRTRLEKLTDKIRPLEQERNDLLEAIAIFEKKEEATGSANPPATPADSSEQTSEKSTGSRTLKDILTKHTQQA